MCVCVCVITNTVSSPISLKSARPCRCFRSSFFPFFSCSERERWEERNSMCPSFTAIVPLSSIIHLTALHYPSLFPSFSLHFYPLTPLLHPPSYHSFFYSSSMFFSPRKKKPSNTCLLAAGLSPASPNLSLPWHWLAGAAAELVLAGSSR